MADELQGRRDTIQRLIRGQVIATQQELGEQLAKEGFVVNQATLSRDLAKLGARRAPRTEGGFAYELPTAPTPATPDGLAAVHHLILWVDASDAMVVIRTKPGGAPMVAATIDSVRPEFVLGTLAGDDTVFVVPRKGKPSKVATSFQAIWKKGSYT